MNNNNSNNFNNYFNLDYCPYKILQLKYDCSTAEIKSQFKRLALKYHPDKYKQTTNDINIIKQNEERAKRIIESYKILSCPVKRKRYDFDNNINNTKIKYKDFNEAIEDLFDNAPPEIFQRFGKMYENIIDSNEMKLCSSIYNSLPNELKAKIDLVKNNRFIYDLNGGLQFMLKKYYDIDPGDKDTDIDTASMYSDTASMYTDTTHTNKTYKTNETNETYKTDNNVNIRKEPEIETFSGNFKNELKTLIIDKHINDLNNLNKDSNNNSNNRELAKDNLTDLDIISDSFLEDYDYDLTFVHHNVIPINISIDIKDKYERIIKHIKLKKNERIINIPIFCIKDSYLLDHVLEDQAIQIIINVRPHNLYIKNNDIIYKKNVSLYEYYFSCNYKIPLPNDEFLDVNDSNIYSKKCKIEEGKGMPKTEYKNGNIIIFYELKLPEKIEDIYKSVIQAIFPPLN